MPANGEVRGTNTSSLLQRSSSSTHYQTFPTAPPRDAGRKSAEQDSKSNGSLLSSGRRDDDHGRASSSHSDNQRQQTPLPKSQLVVLAIIALAEQTALNSISPYLPDMASTFPEVEEGEIGLYVGLIASAFALAQFATNFLWGWLSDRVGRKPIVLVGTLLTAACFVGFGFSRTLWQAVLAQALMGLVNGNQGVISTCLGEITDRSNQSRAFTYLPVIYGIGGITGPLLGGLLVLKSNPFKPDQPNPYPYLPPNLVAAAVLLVDFVVTAIFLEESLEGAQDLPPLKTRVESLFSWIWQFSSSHKPTYITRASKKPSGRSRSYQPVARSSDAADTPDHDDHSSDEEEDSDDDENNTSSTPQLAIGGEESFSSKHVFNRDTTLLFITYLIFQLGNIGYNSLYPIFSEARPPTGRSLRPQEIGTSQAFAGLVTIVFQVGIFGRLRERIGNKTTYRVCLAGFVIAFLLMPWVGYKDGANGQGAATKAGTVWLWIELGGILIIKTVASVGGLTSALLLITNSAPSHQVLGTLNGLAQTLSAAGRAVGPFVSGSLFSAATRVRPKGEAMAFGIFAGITFLGFLMSFGIRGAALEAEGWDESEEEEDDEELGDSDSAASNERRT